MSNRHLALYPGSFDPITLGHVDIINRGLQVFDRIVVAIAVNPRKTPTFTVEKRIQLIEEVFPDRDRVEVVAFTGLLVDYCKHRGIPLVLRGLRAANDFEYEFQMASMNRHLMPKIDFVFLMTSEEHYYIASSLIREIAYHGGDVTGLVPEPVQKALVERYAQLG